MVDLLLSNDRLLGSTPTGASILLLGLLLASWLLCVHCPIGSTLTGSIIFLLVLFVVGSITSSTTFFVLGHLFLCFSLLSYFPRVIFWFLSISRWRFRGVYLRSVELLLRFLRVSQFLLFLVVDSLCGVSQPSIILACP